VAFWPHDADGRDFMASETDQLREKIKSKMDVAKFFSGFISLLIGFLLKDNPRTDTWSKAGLVFLVASLGYCIAAVFAYDRLLMPRKYWTILKERDGGDDSFSDNLQQNMVRSWSWLFVPAVACFGIGLVLVLVPALKLVDCGSGQNNLEGILLGVLLLAAVPSPLVLGRLKGPRIYD
jgi:hypothetical protein